MNVTLGAIALGLAAWAGVVALFALIRPVEGRHALTMQLSLTLLRYDEGFELLVANSARQPTWWEDADPAERHLIDRALSMWDLAAWYVATRRIDRRAVLDVFAWRIVDLWERAYPYIQHRRSEQPTLWSSLAELYVDAYGVSPRPARHAAAAAQPAAALATEPATEPATELATELATEPARSVSPEEIPEEPPPPPPPPPPVAVDLRPEARGRRRSDQLGAAPPATVRRRRSDDAESVLAGEPPAAPPAEELPAEELPPEAPPAEEPAGAAPTDPRPTEEPLNPWAEALRRAGPVVPPSPFQRPDVELLQLQAALLQPALAGAAERTPAPEPPRPRPRPPRVLEVDLTVEHVVDLVEARGSPRREVGG